MKDLHVIKDDLAHLLRSLGPNLRQGYADMNKEVMTKPDSTLLTMYDTQTNARILEHLQNTYPDISIISEEAPTIDTGSEYAFLVDPIDGTRSFSRHIPGFCSGIALVKDYKTLLCLTYNPVLDELFWAIEGHGTYLNDTKVQVSSKDFAHADVEIDVFLYDKPIATILGAIIEKGCMLRSDLAMHYSLSGVASARFEGAVGRLAHPWDYCQYLLVQEAGGTVTDWQGEPFDISKDHMIASNGVIHQDLLIAVQGHE